MMRFHSQTAGVTLTAQQPMNNIVRVAYQAMAAVLGGTQSLHTNSMDETLALPTEHAVQVALRTQQVLAFESGVPNVIDPLGGSYYVEQLTDKLEAEAEAMFTEIEEQGGVVRGLETGWFQRKIAEAAARQQWEIEQRRRVIVGVNEFVTEEDALSIPLLKIDEQAARDQAAALAKLRTTRDGALCDRNIAALRKAAAGKENVVPFILECARSYCTLYEIRAALESVFGAYREPVFF
jgi:methylmalonyl-CoA mutase N-terminal domain/subunit